MNIENVVKNKLQWRNLARKCDEKFKNNGDGSAFFILAWYENVSEKFVTLKMICDTLLNLGNFKLKSFFISREICVCY
jgi:hypothetical protein